MHRDSMRCLYTCCTSEERLFGSGYFILISPNSPAIIYKSYCVFIQRSNSHIYNKTACPIFIIMNNQNTVLYCGNTMINLKHYT